VILRGAAIRRPGWAAFLLAFPPRQAHRRGVVQTEYVALAGTKKEKKDLLAMAYFPTGLPRQYHRRWRA
jgi:hypothetical protein